jgi:hypothetical protein
LKLLHQDAVLTSTGLLPVSWSLQVIGDLADFTLCSDDVVFLIFLYQRWIYRVDKSRANEYGQIAAPDEKDAVTGESKKEK